MQVTTWVPIEGYDRRPPPTSCSARTAVFPSFSIIHSERHRVRHPWPIKTVEWLATSTTTSDDRTGRTINASWTLFIVMSLVACYLWQGRARWHEVEIDRTASENSCGIAQLHRILVIAADAGLGRLGVSAWLPAIHDTVVDWFDSAY